jgi:proteasome lid subunit RPN8/RPN11
MNSDPSTPYTGRDAGTRLNLSPEAETVMRLDAAEAYPYEACGFFFGYVEGNEIFIEDAMPIINSAELNRERRFFIQPRDYQKAEARADQMGRNLLGVYHSHPDHPPFPSQTDLKSALPGFSYIIIEVRGGRPHRLRSWTLNEQGLFDEEPVETVITELGSAFRLDEHRQS